MACVVVACTAPREPGHPGTVAFGGDVVLAVGVHRVFARHGAAYPLARVRPWLEGADYAIANLESVLSDRGTARRASFAFRGRPELVRVLVEGGLDAVTLANNHAGDYGPAALEDCLGTLRRAGIAAVGAGKGTPSARAPIFFRAGDAVVAVVAAASVGPGGAAGTKRAGTNYLSPSTPDEWIRTVEKQVARARHTADVVVLTVHWGENFVDAPDAARRRLARRLVREAGVDAVVGHHAHEVQGIEIVDGRPVIFDVGNLYWASDGRDRERTRSALFLLSVDRLGVRAIEARPLRLGMATVPASAVQAEKTLERIVQLSADLGTPVSVWSGAHLGPLHPRLATPAPDRRFDPPPASARELPDPERVPPAVARAMPDSMEPLSAEFSNGMTLLGFSTRPEVAAGATFPVTTAWRTVRRIGRSVEIELGLHNGERTTWLERHEPGDWSWPTTRWAPGPIVVDRGRMHVPETTAPGTYVVRVALEPRSSLRTDEAVAEVAIGSIEVVPPAEQRPARDHR